MNDKAFQFRINRVADQAKSMRGILDSLGQYDEIRVDAEKLGTALDAAEALSGAVDAIHVRKSVKAIHQELLDAYTTNIDEEGEPDILQLDSALESLIARLTAVADSGDPDWDELGPNARGQVVDSAEFADTLSKLQAGQAAIIERMAAFEQVLTEQAAEQDKVDVAVGLGLISFTRSVSTAKLKELVERMVLSGEKLSGNRLGAATDEVRLALDAFEASISREERSLSVDEGLRGEAESLLAQAKETAQQVRAFVQQVFGSSVAGEPQQDLWPPGTMFRDIDEAWCPEMVVIPAGTFLMGSPEEERRRNNVEGPQHEVVVPRFALGTCAITFAEYDHFCEAAGWGKPDDRDWGRADRPVINVSWRDAQAYCRWLSGETGQRYRLPSEAEWEYACRAGTETPFWWGAEISTDDANYDGTRTYGNGKKGETREQTLPVRSFRPNSFDLWQMHGNVEEWCEDEWHDSYDGVPSDGSAWVTGGDGRKVLRGGSWIDNPRILRSAVRNYRSPGDRIVIVGFRVARTLTPQGHGS